MICLFDIMFILNTVYHDYVFPVYDRRPYINLNNWFFRFLSVKKWLLRKKHQIELARKRGWKGYWVCLKGTTLLFYPCDSREGRSVEAAPKHLIIVDGAIMQPIPEHPKRDYIFCLSTAFGDAYLFQAPCQVIILSFNLVSTSELVSASSYMSEPTFFFELLDFIFLGGTGELGEQHSWRVRSCVCSSSRKDRNIASITGRNIQTRKGYRNRKCNCVILILLELYQAKSKYFGEFDKKFFKYATDF